jgi:hypothetical protein
MLRITFDRGRNQCRTIHYTSEWFSSSNHYTVQTDAIKLTQSKRPSQNIATTDLTSSGYTYLNVSFNII